MVELSQYIDLINKEIFVSNVLFDDLCSIEFLSLPVLYFKHLKILKINKIPLSYDHALFS